MTPNDILHEAAELIGRNGHAKGIYRTPLGEYCAVGSVMTSCGGLGVKLTESADADLYHEALRLLAERGGIEARAGSVEGSIIDWNDHPSTTGEDVILALKRAAHAE